MHTVLGDGIFLMKLTTGNMVLVHPIRSDDSDFHFLPCVYGYATTIRRAQGSSLDMGCVYFDHCYPPERGYGYVAASRFRSKDKIYHFGKIRRTDWLPVGGDESQEQTVRGDESGRSDAEVDEQDRYNEDVFGDEDEDGLLARVRAGTYEEDVFSETGCTGFDDSFDVDVLRGLAEGALDEEDECYPGDEGYDRDFVVDPELYAHEPVAELDALS